MPGQLRFISVAARELRVIARRKRTYIIRWASVAAFFTFLVWLIWMFNGFRRAGVGSDIFHAFATVVFFYCLIVGTAQTADCISSEKREGTLGLLFLTNLNSAEIIAGKLCSTALPTVYGLLAIFPMLGIPLLMGGVTVAEFWKTLLALLGAILFALSCGFVASVVCKRQFAAIALALGLAIGVGSGLLAAAAVMSELKGLKPWVDALSIPSPLYTLVAADGGRPIGRPNFYWQSLVAVAALSLLGLGFVTWRLSRVWQDRPKAARGVFRFVVSERLKQLDATGRAAMRRRLLDINPFYWLAGRNRVSSPVFMLLTLIVTLITVNVTAPFFARMIPAGAIKPVVGSMFAWFFGGLFLHVLVLYYAAMISSQRLAEDRQAGALELILSTPTTERDIARGLWLAFLRRMLFPALVMVLLHIFFIWQVMHAFVMDPSDFNLPRNLGPWELFWALLTGNDLSGRRKIWEIAIMLKGALLFLVMIVIIWFTLALVGRWLGLRMKLAGFAPLAALALVFIPPVILFSVACYVAFETRLMPSNDQLEANIILWSAFSFGVLHCILLCAWASGKLQEEFRSTVVGRAEPVWRRWLPSPRMVLRFIGGSTAFIIALPLFLGGIYGCENFQSRRAWTTFQSQLAGRGESLDVTPLLPAPVASEKDFARSQAFVDVQTGWNKPFHELMNKVGALDAGDLGSTKSTFTWTERKPASLQEFARWLKIRPLPSDPSDNALIAPMILKELAPHTNFMFALAAAARLPAFQISTNRTPAAVLQNPGHYMTMLDRLQFIFTLRATARGETGLTNAAADDVLTSLEFVRLARQSPDMKSAARTQVMLARSLQPLWEGLAKHRWNESHLARFETALAQFNLLADHTNTVRRVSLAYITSWRTAAASGGSGRSIPAWSGGNMSNSSWRQMPRQWWLDNCIRLHHLAGDAVGFVDVDGERVEFGDGWRDISDLPMDSEAHGLFGQFYWQGISPTFIGYAQTSLNQARLAIALERFRIARGAFPETADELVPAYLSRIPRDAMRGLPLIYERSDNEHFILRGTGPNRKNDMKSTTPSDDWLWAYPTNAMTEVKSQ